MPYFKYVFMLGACFVLTACSKNVATCYSQTTTNLAAKIFARNANPALTETQIEAVESRIKLTYARPVAYNKNLMRYTCKANAQINVKPGPFKFPLNYTSQVVNGRQFVAIHPEVLSIDSDKLLGALKQAANLWGSEYIYSPYGVIIIKKEPDFSSQNLGGIVDGLYFNGKRVGRKYHSITIDSVLFTPKVTAFILDKTDGGNCNGCDLYYAGIISDDGNVSFKGTNIGYRTQIKARNEQVIFSSAAHHGVDYGWEYSNGAWAEYQKQIKFNPIKLEKDCKDIYSIYKTCSPAGANGFSDLCMACQSWPEHGKSEYNWSLKEFDKLCKAYNSTGHIASYSAFAGAYCKSGS